MRRKDKWCWSGTGHVLTSNLFMHHQPLWTLFLAISHARSSPVLLDPSLFFPACRSSSKHLIISLAQSQDTLPLHPVTMPTPCRSILLLFKGGSESLSHCLILVGLTPGQRDPSRSCSRAVSSWVRVLSSPDKLLGFLHLPSSLCSFVLTETNLFSHTMTTWRSGLRLAWQRRRRRGVSHH